MNLKRLLLLCKTQNCLLINIHVGQNYPFVESFTNFDLSGESIFSLISMKCELHQDDQKHNNKLGLIILLLVEHLYPSAYIFRYFGINRESIVNTKDPIHYPWECLYWFPYQCLPNHDDQKHDKKLRSHQLQCFLPLFRGTNTPG